MERPWCLSASKSRYHSGMLAGRVLGALAAAAAVWAGCAGEAGRLPPQGPGEGVLFIGNSGPSSFEQVAQSYSAAAEAVGGIYLPVTRAWLEAWRRDPSLQLYSGDQFHPAAQGSYLAAVTIVAVLAGISPVGLPSHVHTAAGGDVSVPAATATLLQESAAAANAQFARQSWIPR